MVNIKLYIAIYVAAALLVAITGRGRRLGFLGYFTASLILTPFIGLLLVVASDPLPVRSRSPQR